MGPCRRLCDPAVAGLLATPVRAVRPSLSAWRVRRAERHCRGVPASCAAGHLFAGLNIAARMERTLTQNTVLSAHPPPVGQLFSAASRASLALALGLIALGDHQRDTMARRSASALRCRRASPGRPRRRLAPLDVSFTYTPERLPGCGSVLTGLALSASNPLPASCFCRCWRRALLGTVFLRAARATMGRHAAQRCGHRAARQRLASLLNVLQLLGQRVRRAEPAGGWPSHPLPAFSEVHDERLRPTTAPGRIHARLLLAKYSV